MMRALTVRQPWAWAIIHAGKDVENRTCNIAGTYRGPVAIHAGVSEDKESWAEFLRSAPLSGKEQATAFVSATYGAVIGVVDLIDVHRDPRCDVPGHQHTLGELSCSAWAQPDHHHLVLNNPRALATPIPARGRLGLWRPDDELAAAIATQLEDGA